MNAPQTQDRSARRTLPASTVTCTQRRQALRATVLAASLVAATGAQALDVEAGDYTALPAGTNLGLVYFQHAERDALYAKGNRVPIQARLDSDVVILRGVHYMEVGGYTIDPQFLLPMGKLKAKDDLAPVLGDGSGVGDLIVGGTVWFNKPSEKTHLGLTTFVTLPTGTYDHNKALNLGENRWKLLFQLGLITPLTSTLTLDAVTDVQLHGRNNDYGAASQTLKQKPLYQTQGWLRYHLSPAADLRLGLSHVVGGKTQIDGVDQDNRTSTSKFALGGSYFVTPTTQLLATYGRDISVREGLKESNRFQLRLLQIL